jgi:hypothetical protein
VLCTEYLYSMRGVETLVIGRRLRTVLMHLVSSALAST